MAKNHSEAGHQNKRSGLTTPIELSAEETARVTAAGNYLGGVVRVSRRFRAEREEGAGATSPFRQAQADITSRAAFQLANALGAAADDHLDALGALLAFAEIPLPLYAGYSLLRAAIEADARACWLLDAAVGPDERTARSLTERLFSIRSQGKLGAPNNAELKRALDGLAKEASAAGIDPVYNRKPGGGERGELAAYRTRRPEATALVGEILDMGTPGGKKIGEDVHRTLSAVLHGTAWALRRGSEVAGSNDGTTSRVADVDSLLDLASLTLIVRDQSMFRLALTTGASDASWIAARGPYRDL